MKEAISNSYMEELKRTHGKKPCKSAGIVLMIGDGKKGSIGEAIKKRLTTDGLICMSFNGDVRNGLANASASDAMVMCHGVTRMAWIEDTKEKDISEILGVNLYGSIRAVQGFVKSTIHTSVRKKIISIGSMAYKSVLNGSAVYCASKAGLAHFMKCAAWELAPKGYDVYSIHPSNTVGTPMTEETINGLMNYRNLSRKEAEDYWASNNPREQFLSTYEIAELVSFILSGRAPYLSGAQLELSGGQR